MKPISIGKFRGLKVCSTPHGALAVLALDHRNNLRRALNPANPDSVGGATMSAFKQHVTQVLAPAASSVLLDPEVGAMQCVTSDALPGNIGLVVAVEATGYAGTSAERESRILDDWSVAKAKAMGANAIKLLIYYHPDSPTASAVEGLVAKVTEECHEADMACFLEPLSYSLDPAEKRLQGEERKQVVIETALRLTAIGGDILKAEFPLDFQNDTDEQHWVDACRELTKASEVPWVLLSASVDYETYLRQVTIALQQGGSGVAVGRAVWKEATDLTGAEREHFLRTVAIERMARLTALCDALATPWASYFTLPVVESNYYKTYGSHVQEPA